jgi:glyoxylate reductase
MAVSPLRARDRIFVTRSLDGLGASGLLDPLADADLRVWEKNRPPAPAELLEAARVCDGLLCLLTDRVGGGLIDACPDLRVISSMSVGVDHIDMQTARARGIAVGHTPGVLTETTADLSFGLMLAAARRIPEADRFVRDGHWNLERRWEPDMLLGVDLHGAVLGVIGLGAIGRAVAARAQGFGMRVLAWTRSGRTAPGVEACELADLLRQADFLSIHVALTSETRGLLGASEIASTRRGAILVNTARGGIVDETALAEALASGQLAAAALDVFEEEPLDPKSPLLTAPNLILAPHIGSASVATRRRMASLAVENLAAGLAGEPMPHRVV